jgi:phospholipase C
VAILPQIEHLVVVMLENRSFDNMCGWLYRDGKQPSQFLPASTKMRRLNGLHQGLFNPTSDAYFKGQPSPTYPIFPRANATNMPDPDPKEEFDNVTKQLYGPFEPPSESPTYPNLGFVVNYALTTGTNIPVQIMEPFSPEQVPVISALARNYAICDEWFCSVPSETWPNRSFVHAGTFNGNVLNGNPPHPNDWDIRTIFNVLEDLGIPWRVYSDTTLPSLTWLMFKKLWHFLFERFAHFDDFKEACARGSLPKYSFVEPGFLKNPNDQHPPHDVVAGEQFLFDIWQAVSQSPAWEKTLLLVTYDEHGGTYDHVMPPWNATAPDAQSDPGKEGFTFHRFGVRVPMVVVSPWIQAGTVFRSDSAIPYDHTSILATLRDWMEIPSDKMLESKRVQLAPNLAQVLNAPSVRTDKPQIPAPHATPQPTSAAKPLNQLQRSLVSASAVQRGFDPEEVLSQMGSRQEASNYFAKQGAHNRPAKL